MCKSERVSMVSFLPLALSDAFAHWGAALASKKRTLLIRQSRFVTRARRVDSCVHPKGPVHIAPKQTVLGKMTHCEY